jgi:hypothetical protein
VIFTVVVLINFQSKSTLQILTRAVCISRGPDPSGALSPAELISHWHG